MIIFVVFIRINYKEVHNNYKYLTFLYFRIDWNKNKIKNNNRSYNYEIRKKHKLVIVFLRLVLN